MVAPSRCWVLSCTPVYRIFPSMCITPSRAGRRTTWRYRPCRSLGYRCFVSIWQRFISKYHFFVHCTEGNIVITLHPRGEHAANSLPGAPPFVCLGFGLCCRARMTLQREWANAKPWPPLCVTADTDNGDVRAFPPIKCFESFAGCGDNGSQVFILKTRSPP